MDIFTAHRAKVVLFTMPYVDPSQEAADGQPFMENDPTRMDAFNRILRQVAKERSSVVTLVDLNKLLDPDGHFQAVIDGVTVRTTDGIHITEPGGAVAPPAHPPDHRLAWLLGPAGRRRHLGLQGLRRRCYPVQPDRPRRIPLP